MSEHAPAGTATLRHTQFQNLLVRLHPDRNQAGEKYEELRRKLIKFFEWNSCSAPEDLVDETLDRVAKRLGAEEVRDVSAFAWGVAKNVRQEAQKRSARLVPISDLPQGANPLREKENLENAIQERMDQGRRSQCFLLCLQCLGTKDRDLFLKYHSAGEQAATERQHLADDFGLTIAALRVRINRMRERIERCVAGCMKR
jgi:DNA-directed RNA polymerase specialized sigma24 family protein